MESTNAVSTARAQVCIVFQDFAAVKRKGIQWPPGAEDFVRKLYRQGVQIIVIGPRPEERIGIKKQLRYFDRHEVIALKELARAKNQGIELKVMSSKLRAWTRIRTEVCVVSGIDGVWHNSFKGWNSNGVLTLDSLNRFVNEFDLMPGSRYLFLGSSNRVLSWASYLLDHGAEACMVVEPDADLKCWRSHRDRFVTKGGRIFCKHEILKIQQDASGVSAVFLQNEEGTLVLNANTVVFSSTNREALNQSSEVNRGLFYIQRQFSAEDPVKDEQVFFAKLDWSQTYWRVARTLKLVSHSDATGALEKIKRERKLYAGYSKQRQPLHYNGKNLTQESVRFVQSSGGSPKAFLTEKPIASLECLEELACNACIEMCQVDAISKPSLISLPQLNVGACTGCGACVAICPSGAAVMVKELHERQMARYFLPDDTSLLWREGESIKVLNRRGENLGSGRVIGSTTYAGGAHRVLEIESPSYNLWDARNFRRNKCIKGIEEDQNKFQAVNRSWVTINGAKRLCPINVPLTVALWQLGFRRFEDALFCVSGGCRMCAILVNGKPVLACREIVKEGSVIEFDWKTSDKVELSAASSFDCHCSRVEKSQIHEMVKGGISLPLSKEITGFGNGLCKGRWCSSKISADSKIVRPEWHGYQASPWQELWVEDVLPPSGGTINTRTNKAE